MTSQKPHLTFFQLINMSVGFFGIQFGWGLQMANMSAIFEHLGAQAHQIPILWLAAPLTGLFVQPIIGHMSDNTWNFLGRRRPLLFSRCYSQCDRLNFHAQFLQSLDGCWSLMDTRYLR